MARLNAALAAHLAPDAAEPASTARVAERLRERVRRSALALQGFVTVRHGDTPWTDWVEGARTRALHDDGVLRSLMLELQAGAALPPPGDALAQEIVLLRGGLAGPARLGPQGFCLRTRAQPGAWTAPQGALLYVRERYGAHDSLPAAEAAWWPADDAPAVIVPEGDTGWLPFSPGVQIKPLAGGDGAVSTLARFQAGARVAKHGHALAEDCVMLEGDLYLSDTLLREGEYQIAPAGSSHSGLLSDHGAVLYFHGAIDPALRGEA